MALSSGALGAIGNIVGGVSNVWGALANSKTTHDTLNKQSEINDRGYAYNLEAMQIQAANFKRNAVVVVSSLIVLIVVIAISYKLTQKRS